MVTQRRSHEPGHRRKFMVVIDDTPECLRAPVYAARRAEHTGGILLMLHVIAPGEFQHWLGVEEIMRAEAQEAAQEAFALATEAVQAHADIKPDLVIREGTRSEEILKLIDEDQDIAILVLAAAPGKEGPGPLVTSIASGGGFPIPVTIVPAALSDEDIDALA